MTTHLPGGRVRVSLQPDGVWSATEIRPLEQPTDDEHRAFTSAGYYALSRLDLMRRLRAAEEGEATRHLGG